MTARSPRQIAVRAALVAVAALVVQVSIVTDIRVAQAVGDIMLVLVVAAALTGGRDRGATYGFAIGVLYDLVLDSPFGLSALTYALIGYAAGMLGGLIGRTSGWWPVMVAALAGAATAVLYTSLGILVGVAYPFGRVPVVAAVMAVVAALAITPTMRLLWWIHGHPEADRLEMMFR